MHILQQDAHPLKGCTFCNRVYALQQDAFCNRIYVLRQDACFATGCVPRQDAHFVTGYMSCDKTSSLAPPTSASRRLCMAVSAELLDSSNLSSATLTSSSVTLEPGQPTSTPCQHEHGQSRAWGTFSIDQILSTHALHQIRYSLHTPYSSCDDKRGQHDGVINGKLSINKMCLRIFYVQMDYLKSNKNAKV